MLRFKSVKEIMAYYRDKRREVDLLRITAFDSMPEGADRSAPEAEFAERDARLDHDEAADIEELQAHNTQRVMAEAVESGRRYQLLYDTRRVLGWATVMAERLKIATDKAQGRQGRPWDFTDPGFDYDRWKSWMGSWRNWLPTIRGRALKEMGSRLRADSAEYETERLALEVRIAAEYEAWNDHAGAVEIGHAEWANLVTEAAALGIPYDAIIAEGEEGRDPELWLTNRDWTVYPLVVMESQTLEPIEVVLQANVPEETAVPEIGWREQYAKKPNKAKGPRNFEGPHARALAYIASERALLDTASDAWTHLTVEWHNVRKIRADGRLRAAYGPDVPAREGRPCVRLWTRRRSDPELRVWFTDTDTFAVYVVVNGLPLRNVAR